MAEFSRQIRVLALLVVVSLAVPAAAQTGPAPNSPEGALNSFGVDTGRTPDAGFRAQSQVDPTIRGSIVKEDEDARELPPGVGVEMLIVLLVLLVPILWLVSRVVSHRRYMSRRTRRR